MSKYSPEKIEHAVALREQGLTYNAVAARTGMSRGAVLYHCLKLGAESPRDQGPSREYRGPTIVRRGGHVVKRFTPAEDRQLLALARDGVTPAVIARRLNRAPHSVTGRLMTLARREAREEANA